jgi:hypothetical protein
MAAQIAHKAGSCARKRGRAALVRKDRPARPSRLVRPSYRPPSTTRTERQSTRRAKTHRDEATPIIFVAASATMRKSAQLGGRRCWFCDLTGTFRLCLRGCWFCYQALARALRLAIVMRRTSLISATLQAVGSKSTALSRPSHSSMSSWASWLGSARDSFRSA